MSHLKEEDLILHVYGESEEPASVEAHVAGCPRCRQEYATLKDILAEVPEPTVPELPPDYGRRVWERLEGKLETPSRKSLVSRHAWLLAAAAVVLAATFLAGRLSTRWGTPDPVAPAEIRERILLVALSEHLESSQVLLLEVANRAAGEIADSPRERERAEELLRQSRLYRQTAYRLGDVVTAGVLEELERLLLDLSHGPESLEAREALQSRLENEDLLFKIRVLRTSVQRREEQMSSRRF